MLFCFFALEFLKERLRVDDALEDQAMYDDADMDVQSGGANTKGAVTQGTTHTA